MIQININFIPRSSEIFIVGGTVRDFVLGRPPKDYDIATTGNPEALAQEIAEKSKGRLVLLGKPGMMLFRVVTPEHTFDIVPANGGSIESDLQQRDFTINAMAASAKDGRLIDLHNGLGDLAGKKVRMVSRQNLVSDPIRLLRAYRMGAALNFSIDGPTRSAIRDEAQRIGSAAGERIRDELMKLFMAPTSFPYIEDMANIGLLDAIFPEMKPLKECKQNLHHHHDAFMHSLTAYSCLEYLIHRPQTNFSGSEDIENIKSLWPHTALLKYAILLHDIGKPLSRSIDAKGKIHFYRHEKKSAGIAQSIHTRLRFSNKDCRYVDFIISNHIRPLLLFIAHRNNRLSPKAIFRFLTKSGEYTVDLFIHAIADMKGKGNHPDEPDFIEFSKEMIRIYRNRFLPVSTLRPIINGDDLISEFNLSPSPLFRKILDHIRQERLLSHILTREDALKHVEKFLKLHQQA